MVVVEVEDVVNGGVDEGIINALGIYRLSRLLDIAKRFVILTRTLVFAPIFHGRDAG